MKTASKLTDFIYKKTGNLFKTLILFTVALFIQTLGDNATHTGT